jgi:hypothetical protein
MVAGITGLVIQMFTEGLFGYPGTTWPNRADFTPHLTTTRVLTTVGARQLPYANANRFQQGWGFPNVQALYDNRDRILVLDEEDVLRQGASRTYVTFVRPGTPELRASMHYLEPEAVPFSVPNRVNSLDLQVVAPDGTVYWGNDPGLLSGPFSSPGGDPNDVDVHENVFLSNPAPGPYQVTVRAAAIRQDAHLETPEMDADFALAVSGIAGGRDTSGMLLDLDSSQPGEWTVSLANLPASWIGGVTAMSFDTDRYLGLGNLFGLEADGLTFGILPVFPTPGNVFAFTNTSDPSLYPNAVFRFPAGVAIALQGLTLDAVAFVYDATGIVDVSNVDRVAIQ